MNQIIISVNSVPKLVFEVTAFKIHKIIIVGEDVEKVEASHTLLEGM